MRSSNPNLQQTMRCWKCHVTCLIVSHSLSLSVNLTPSETPPRSGRRILSPPMLYNVLSPKCRDQHSPTNGLFYLSNPVIMMKTLLTKCPHLDWNHQINIGLLDCNISTCFTILWMAINPYTEAMSSIFSTPWTWECLVWIPTSLAFYLLGAFF